MADDHDGKGGEEKPEAAFLQFTESAGRVDMTTNIPETLSRYALWLAGLEVMFRANTMADLRAEAAKTQIVTPGMSERVALGILK